MILIIILIVVFVVIIVWNLLNIREGLETYEDYDLSADSQCMILANQNAGNISYLKQRVDELANIQSMIYDLSMNVDELNTEMSGVVQQQMDYAEEIAGGTTPYEISGTTLTDDSL